MQEEDWPAVWSIPRATFESGDAYAFAPESSEAEMHRVWVEVPKHHPADCERAYNLRALALQLLERGEAQEGERVIALAIQVGEQVLGADNRMLGYLYQIAGQANAALLRPSQAEASYRRALEIEQRALGTESSFASQLQANLALVSRNDPRWKQSSAPHEELKALVGGPLATNAPDPLRPPLYVLHMSSESRFRISRL